MYTHSFFHSISSVSSQLYSFLSFFHSNLNTLTDQRHTLHKIDAERSVGSLVFAYADDKLHFFDSDYQEHVYEKQVLDGGPDNTVFLKENTSLVVEYYGGIESSSVKIRLPKEDVFEVREVGSQAVIPAGDKRTLGYVMGVLENGAELIVPDFVKVNLNDTIYLSCLKH